jgi:hypothetical protein
MTDASPEVTGEEQAITRETLKGLMDVGLHVQIDAMSDTYMQYLIPILTEILALEDERKQ